MPDGIGTIAIGMEAEFQIQPFETGLLGRPVGKLYVRGGWPLEERPASLTAGWRREGVWLVSCRVPEGSPAIGGLEKNGFRAIETLVTFRRQLRAELMPGGIAIAGPETADACVAIARRAFTNDRLHRDRRVPDGVADLVRERWIRNNLGGRADASFVARDGGRVVGFSLCLLDGDEAVIDLIAVDGEYRQKGLGRALVLGALAHYGGRARTMQVGTQADNLPSLKLYRGAGFVEAERQITLHWVNSEAAPALKDLSR